MKNNVTELVFILDRSGSMAGLESDTIGGFNAMIEKQKKLDGKCYVSTVLFDSETKVLHDRVSLEDIKLMTTDDYCVGGCTALMDAIGGAIKHIGNIHKYARPEDVPENTMFIITTDGMENASRKYQSNQIKEMIHKQTEKYGWEFIFVAANIDTIETAKHIGIREDRAASYTATPCGTANLYAAMSEAICEMRVKNSISSNWRNNLRR